MGSLFPPLRAILLGVILPLAIRGQSKATAPRGAPDIFAAHLQQCLLTALQLTCWTLWASKLPNFQLPVQIPSCCCLLLQGEPQSPAHSDLFSQLPFHISPAQLIPKLPISQLNSNLKECNFLVLLTPDTFLVKNNPSTVIYQLCRCEQITSPHW